MNLFNYKIENLQNQNGKENDNKPAAPSFPAQDDNNSQYYSKNYIRYLEAKQKMMERNIANCIGWQHVLRAIEVIGMGMRDLVTRVFPEQVKERFLTTSNGKILN